MRRRALLIMTLVAALAVAASGLPASGLPASGLAASGLAASGSTPAARAYVPADGLAVTAYALPSTRPAIVRRDAEALSTVTVAAVSLRPDGGSTTQPEDRAVRLVEVAPA